MDLIKWISVGWVEVPYASKEACQEVGLLSLMDVQIPMPLDHSLDGAAVHAEHAVDLPAVDLLVVEPPPDGRLAHVKQARGLTDPKPLKIVINIG